MTPPAAPAAAPRPARAIWFVIWASLTAAPVIYFVVARIVATETPTAASLPLLRTVFGAIAVIELLAGALLVTRTPNARSDPNALASFFGGTALAEPVAFQRAFVLATALIEACAILGFVLVFLGASPLEYAWYGAASMAVMLGIALPTGLRYWGERERADAGANEPIV